MIQLFFGKPLTMTFLLCLAFSFNSFSQISEELITEDIRMKMDENKQSGISLMSGIVLSIELEFQGITSEGKKQELIEGLSSQLQAVVKQVSEENYFLFEIPAQYGLDEIKQVAKSIDVELGRLNGMSLVLQN